MHIHVGYEWLQLLQEPFLHGCAWLTSHGMCVWLTQCLVLFASLLTLYHPGNCGSLFTSVVIYYLLVVCTYNILLYSLRSA